MAQCLTQEEYVQSNMYLARVEYSAEYRIQPNGEKKSRTHIKGYPDACAGFTFLIPYIELKQLKYPKL